MKKYIFTLMAVFILSSCAENKTFTKNDGTTFTAEPYGWANYQSKKIEGVVYECCFGNVIWGIIGAETIVIPVWLSGWELYQPVNYEEVTNNNK